MKSRVKMPQAEEKGKRKKGESLFSNSFVSVCECLNQSVHWQDSSASPCLHAALKEKKKHNKIKKRDAVKRPVKEQNNERTEGQCVSKKKR